MEYISRIGSQVEHSFDKIVDTRYEIIEILQKPASVVSETVDQLFPKVVHQLQVELPNFKAGISELQVELPYFLLQEKAKIPLTWDLRSWSDWCR